MLAAVTLSIAAHAALAQHPAGLQVKTRPFQPSATDPVEAERERARFDYVLHCSGCHFLHGEGSQAGGIPRVRDQVGYFLQLPEGRAYLMQVPGLLSASLSDADAARVVNWMIDYFAGASKPPDFVPYTAEEARRYRLQKPADILATRQRIAAQLQAAGYPFR